MSSFPLLAFVFLAISGADGWGAASPCFFVLVAAVIVRETARPAGCCLARTAPARRSPAALRRAVCLRQPREPGECQPGRRPVCPGLCRPGRQLATALALAAAILGAGGNINLFDQPLLTPHICCAAWSGCRPSSACSTFCPPIRSISAVCSAAASPASTASLSPAAPPPAWARCSPLPP